jgi:hypothetical protein
MDFIELDGYQYESDCELDGYQYESDCELGDVNLHQNESFVFLIKIQCRDLEGNMVYHNHWSTEDGLSKCPINELGHTVVSFDILQRIGNNYNNPVVNDSFSSKAYYFDIPAGPLNKIYNILFPYSVRIYNVSVSTSEGENDIISVFFEKVSGLITLPIDRGNVLKVNNTSQITLGDTIIVEDGINIHDLGQCIRKNETEIVCSRNSQSLINRNSIVKVRKYFINSISPSNRMIFNANGFFLPPNLTIKIDYQNNTTNNKTLYLNMEIFH